MITSRVFSCDIVRYNSARCLMFWDEMFNCWMPVLDMTLFGEDLSQNALACSLKEARKPDGNLWIPESALEWDFITL